MAVSPQKLIKVIKEQVNSVDESVPGYKDELFQKLVQIVSLEREHLEARTQIQIRVTEQIKALAHFVLREKGEIT